MKVIFICSFSGKEFYQKYYDLIIQSLNSYGVEVISAENINQYSRLFTEENIKEFGGRKQIHENFINKGIENADAVIVENTHPSFKIGYEVNFALQHNKPVLCLSLENDQEDLIQDPLYFGKKYTDDSLNNIISSFLGAIENDLKIEDVFNDITINSNSERNVVGVIGAINFDITSYLEKLPQISNNYDSSSLTLGLRNTLGGKGANVAVALSNLGIGSFMISKVGDDILGKRCLSLLARRNVSLDFTYIDRLSSTGEVITLIDRNNNIQTVVHEGANARLNKEAIDNFIKYKNPKMLYLTFEPQKEIVDYVIQVAQDKNIPLFVNASPALPTFSKDLLSKIEFIIMNKAEAKHITGENVDNLISAQKAADILRSFGSQNIIITLRDEGSIILAKGEKTSIYYKSKRVKAINQIGAGDAFAAGFISSYFKNQDLDKAMQFATLVGAFAVTRTGDFESMPTFDDLKSIGFISEAED